MKGIPRVFKKEDAEFINKIRQEYQGKVITKAKLLELLSPLKNPTVIVRKFANFSSPILIKVGKGRYKFQDNPIYFQKMQRAWDYKSEDQKRVINPIEQAITLLKSNGFKVFQQDFDLDKALANPDAPVNQFIEWTEM